jgi:transposase
VADARDHQRHLLRNSGGLPVAAAAYDLPPWGTIYRWFAALRDDGRLERINHALVMVDRERVGRDAATSIARPQSIAVWPHPTRTAEYFEISRKTKLDVSALEAGAVAAE